MYNYRIDILPLNHYFFSGEQKYRSTILVTDGKYDDSNRELQMDYFQVSRKMPQQTTILGALRYFMLLEHGQIPIKDSDKAEKLIGESSFKMLNNSDEAYGSIHRISPLSINHRNSGTDYQWNNKDSGLDNESFIDFKLEKSLLSAPDNKSVYSYSNYNEKDYYDSYLVGTDGSKKSADEIFISQNTVGIRKSKTGASKENAFFKHLAYKLADNYCFRVYAKLDSTIEKMANIIPIGADGNLFKVTVQKLSTPQTKFTHTDNYNTVTLQSDTLLSDSAYLLLKDSILFSRCRIKPFRYIKSKVTKGNKYYNSNPIGIKRGDIKNDDTGIARSRKYNVMESGSIFYFDQHETAKAFTTSIDNEKHMKTIGYNHYTTKFTQL